MRAVVIYFLVILIVSCSATTNPSLKPSINVKSKPEKKTKNSVMTFATTDGQDQADLKLALFDDQTFKFWLTIFSPEESSQEHSEYEGKWSKQDDRILIKFVGKKPILSALIDQKNTTIQLINDSSFSFSGKSDQLIIWQLLLNRL